MNSKKNLKRNLLICLLAGSAVMYTLPLHAATSVIGNNTLPTGGNFVHGSGDIKSSGLEMNIVQNDRNAVIKWGSFDVGGSATVNFSAEGAYANNFNTLNYVNSASASQIYGTINAQGGNIFIVNPAGVQIGNSAQINVGSLYVSNKYLNESELGAFAGTITPEMINATKTADAALMSLGNINAATNVTFDGDRIVLDTERVIFENTNPNIKPTLNIKTTNADSVVLGYDAYDEDTKYNHTVNNEKTFNITKVNINNNGPDNITVNEETATVKGYMWVEDVNQLQAINTNLGGNYALRNSIDATGTAQNSFKPIGSDSNAFYGKFDGIDYNIFGLNIDNNGKSNTGLFGETNGAVINNVTLVGGKIVGGNDTGALIGHAINTTVTNVVNSAEVNGNINVGGIIGASTGSVISNAINTGSVNSNGGSDNKGGTVSSAGGLIGAMYEGSKLIGNSYNLGDVSGDGYNVGGLVGHAVNSVIGNPSVVDGKPVENVQVVYNRLDVSGAYNVGGIVGNMEGTTVQNAENSGTVLATGYRTEDYIYHTGETNKSNIPNNGSLNNGVVSVNVNVANVGGIAGKADDTVKADGTVDKKSEIKNVTNSGNVSSSKQAGNDYYDAGNVGGIVGSAVDTNITNATNKENEVRGAHNVGGVAGYFGNSNVNNNIKYTINRGINDGGDIMATGARKDSSFVTEIIRPVNKNQTEKFIIGNIGGIAGYMDGDNVYITGSGNRGTVHTDEPANPANVEEWQKAANVGGIVGKIDRSDTKKLDANNNIVDANRNLAQAAVSDSYNTGDVLGYTGIGGIAGLMYNGEIASSYNLGYLRSTRQSYVGAAEGNTEVVDALNMGGIVGDTTEESNATALLYDVYNKGQIGDKEFNYFGRHVGGVVGRLSGTVEKAYNTGAIYNGYNVVGGIAGWVAAGTIQNAFNTGNITVYNQNESTSQVGGIAGAANGGGNVLINNVYNLGTLRSFDIGYGKNAVAGILGTASGKGTVTIKNAYTTGNLYSGVKVSNNSFVKDMDSISADNGINRKVSSMYASTEWHANVDASHNTYYIKPDIVNNKPLFAVVVNNTALQAVEFANKSSYTYNFDGQITKPDKTMGSVDDENTAWRIYDGNTPILNAFLPDSEKYFSNGLKDNGGEFIGTIQYGTAYDPLLTIINTNRDLAFNFGTGINELSISNAAGIAVYGGGVTLNNFTTNSGSGYFGGTIYADGALNLNGGKNDIGLGSAADIYGSAVNITTDGKVTIYGDVTATGNTDNGTTEVIDSSLTVENAGDINIAGSDVDVYGTLTSASNTQGANVKIPGIEDSAVTWTPGEINNPYASMADIADRFAHTTGDSAVDGNITITANGTWNDADNDNIKDEGEVTGGNVNLYYGNKEQGLITTEGDLTVTGTGDVYVDSDLDIGDDMTLRSTGADSEVVLDITNIGQVQAKNELAKNPASQVTAAEKLHEFMHHFSNTNGDGANIYLNAKNSNDTKITVDMWDGEKFDLKKFDTKDADGTTHEFKTEIDFMNVTVNGEKLGGTGNNHVKDYTYIWVSDGEQLKGIQQSAKENNNFLDFNFALKNDINASDIGNGYEAIGGTTGYNGTFDGRGNRIIGLTVSGENAGIFSTVGTNGVVKDVNIYSGTFTGSENAGAVAGKNNGRIEGIVTFGNTVTATGDNGNASNAGGIVGVNNSGTFANNANDGELTGGIYDVESTGSVIAGSSDAVAGGLVGTNDGGLANSFSDSAVTVGTNVTGGTSAGLGGVVGVNTEKGNVQYVDSLGVTNGGATNSSNIGGIIGTNNGNMYSGYNESIVSGANNVGGIIGTNAEGKKVENVVNATGVEGKDNVGGLVGVNSGSVTNGRNNGTITGVKYVGGMVGSNEADATLKNLVNDSSAAITGEQYVGGIAGDNAGIITTGNEETDETVNLINRGTITGQQYVGGVAGSNSGTITNANNDVELNVKDKNQIAQYFGGIAGVNTGTINKATNTADVNADGATYVGGIVGKNDGTLKDMAGNSGNVTGENYVGGVAGLNNKDIDGVTASNDGVVKATEGGADGIFAENTGNITNSTLINNKTVAGAGANGATGGIIGVNSGNISRTSLKNEVDGQVIGMNNVGGLIGVNTGTITGGRNESAEYDENGNLTAEADSYYKYQIYNNGVINVGTWTDRDGDGVVDVDTKEFNAQAGSNIGGLIGNNAVDDSDPDNVKTGSLTAGYNTGAINASGSTNVGGIAGSNSGTIDQVFNTIMVADGALDLNGKTQSVAVTGGTIVGGLVGNNTGTITNAYNTSNVVATNQDGIVGNLVGTNSGTVQYVYGVANDLIGSGTGSIKNYHVIDGSDKWLQEGTYDGFTFGANGWKIYDGSTLPMLSVFLTKVTVVDQHLVNQYFSAKHYGELHQITADDIKALIAIGAISAPDGFGAFNNNNGLIQGVADDAMANSGNWLYSQQILGSNINGLFNPNNLGYDISLVYSPFELDNDPSSHWNYLFNDAPFDRNKDFRERKAEVNFVDGGMEI